VDLTDNEINRRIAEHLGWKYETKAGYPVGPVWWSPDGMEGNAMQPDSLTDPAMTLLLLERMPEPEVWLESEPGEPKKWGCKADMADHFGVIFDADLKRCVALAYLKAFGLEES
jgi:hypothetical protein